MEEREIETRIRRLLGDHRDISRAIRDMEEKPSIFEKGILETLDRHITLAIVGLLHADLADRIDAALKEYRVAATACVGADPDIFDRKEALDLLERTVVAHKIVGMRRADPAPVVDPCDTPPAGRPWAGGTDRGRIKGVLARFAEAVAAGCRAYGGPERDAHLGDLVEEASRQVCDLMGDAPAPVTPGDAAWPRIEVDRPIETGAEIEAGPGDGDTPLPECRARRFALVAPWGTWEHGTLVGIDGTGDTALCTLKLDSGEVLTATRPQLKALGEEGS